jgi:hypothetical protein
MVDQTVVAAATELNKGALSARRYTRGAGAALFAVGALTLAHHFYTTTTTTTTTTTGITNATAKTSPH